MFKNILLLSLRNFSKNKGYALLNLLGLISGLISFILISTWVDYERSVDKFHHKDERLFRVLRNTTHEDGNLHTDFVMSKPLAEALETDYPEIENATLVFWEEELFFVNKEKVIKDNGFYAGKNFFSTFSFPLLEGDAASVLADIRSVAISESLSAKLFGTTKSIGNIVEIKNIGDFKITGVFRNVPDNSTLKFDYILPVEKYIQSNNWVHVWDNYGFKIYVTLKPEADLQAVNAKISGIARKYFPTSKDEIFLQPFSEAYLYSDFENGKPSGGRIEQVNLFAAVGLFMLLIAGINFINLSTALATRRAKEVGIRKVLGVAKRFLTIQFLFETSLVVFIAIVAALAMSGFVFPYFSQLTGTVLSLQYFNLYFWLLMVALWIIMTLLAGLYPAMILSGFDPVQILKGRSGENRSNEFVRRGLVVLQFSISIVLIIGTFVIFRQNNYIRNKDFGLEKENIIQIALDGSLKQNYQVLKHQLLSIAGVESVTASGQNPMEVTSTVTGLLWKGKSPNEEIGFSMITADYDFLETFEIPLTAGRDFSRKFPADSVNFLVNEKAVEVMAQQDPVGAELQLGPEKGAIVGVVKDFYNATLYSPIKPLIIKLQPENTDRIFVRVTANSVQQVLESIQGTIKTYNTDSPFEYVFLDQNFEQRYRREALTNKLIQLFTFVIIIISCLGLFALSTYSAERRSKEVGIRKVLGASVSSITFLMSGSFIKLVLLSYIVAVPVSYFLVDEYLSKFAYHIDIGSDSYLLAGVLAIAISLLTTVYQSLRSANLNPVKVLRDS